MPRQRPPHLHLSPARQHLQLSTYCPVSLVADLVVPLLACFSRTELKIDKNIALTLHVVEECDFGNTISEKHYLQKMFESSKTINLISRTPISRRGIKISRASISENPRDCPCSFWVARLSIIKESILFRLSSQASPVLFLSS